MTAVRTAYFLRVPNVGDRVNAVVVEAVAKRPVLCVADRRAPHVLAIGSMMVSATPHSVVWGTGVMHPDIGVGQPDAACIYAVRGPLSHAALRGAGVAVKDVPFGDPAYAAPSILGVRRAAARSTIGLVAHYVDQRDPNVARIAQEDGVVFLDVHAAPDAFLRTMAECSVVLSSSLHGLVFAEALGIPNLWLRAGDGIAGGDFKFRDWFATTRRPQAAPHVLSARDTAVDLARRAEPHDSAVDVDALLAAFPRERVEECSTPTTPRFRAARHCARRPLPVFLISCDRGAMLARCIAGIRRQARATEIVVHDNGSTDAATVATLDTLAADGIRVVHQGRISTPDDLDGVDRTVQAFFADWGETGRYVVSDCDVDLSVASPDALDLYDELLNRHRHVECVGPMLRIRDIPRDYPLFTRVMNRHIEQFWQHTPVVESTRFGEIAFLEHVIDTTFALHRAGEPFRRLKTALRVYEPYEALHLDWYRGEADDDGYTRTSSPEISHWNNLVERARHRDEPLRFSEFAAVRRTPAGTIEVYARSVADPSS